MWKEYEDYCEDELEYEFTEKLNRQILEYVNDNIKAKLRDYEQVMQENKEMVETFRQLKADKQQALFELEKLKERNFDSITNGIKASDRIWRIEYNTKKEDCDKCGGNKLLPVTYENEVMNIKCNKCEGRGHRTLITYQPLEFGIKNIEVVTEGANKFDVYIRDHYSNTHKLKNVFKTKEECQAEIDSNDEYKPNYRNW